MAIRQFMISCCGAFLIGMLAGIAAVSVVKLKNLSIKRKHEFKEPASLKRNDISLSGEIMDIPSRDTVDGHNALQEFRQHD